MLTAERLPTRRATSPVEDLPCAVSPRPAANTFHDFGPALEPAHALAAAFIAVLPSSVLKKPVRGRRDVASGAWHGHSEVVRPW